MMRNSIYTQKILMGVCASIRNLLFLWMEKVICFSAMKILDRSVHVPNMDADPQKNHLDDWNVVLRYLFDNRNYFGAAYFSITRPIDAMLINSKYASNNGFWFMRKPVH